MRALWRHVWAALRGEHALGARPDVRRVFVCCKTCQRVVPIWRLIVKKIQPGQRLGCKCGKQEVETQRISEWRAAWWFLVRGLLVRYLILRRPDWDPRLPTVIR